MTPKRKRPPEDTGGPQPSPDHRAGSVTGSTTTAPVPATPPDTAAPAHTGAGRRLWNQLLGRVWAALAQTRVLLFVYIHDEAPCPRVRRHLQIVRKSAVWLALRKVPIAAAEATDDDVTQVLEALDAEDEAALDGVLISLLVLVLLGRVREDQPLVTKLQPGRQEQVEVALGRSVRTTLANTRQQLDHPRLQTWFRLRIQTSMAPARRTLADLHALPPTAQWMPRPEYHQRKRDAFDRWVELLRELAESTRALKALKKSVDQDERELSSLQQQVKRLNAEKKLLQCRSRKYRLFPSAEQSRQLRRFLGTCRWTWNQATAHFRATSVSKASTLQNLYVTKQSKTPRMYPAGMGSPPAWVFETPSCFRAKTVRKFKAAVSAAFSNLTRGKINHFKMGFKGRNKNPLLVLGVERKMAKIERTTQTSRPLLSIPGLRRIPMRWEPDVAISTDFEIILGNGLWLAVIPQYLRSPDLDAHGRCIALDPGLRTFQTGVDLDGSVVEIGRGTHAHLGRLQDRASQSQHDMAVIRNQHGHRSRKRWRALVRARRGFNAATAKLKNAVQELHHQASAFLTKQYDTIVLPIFQTMNMVKPSKPSNHAFNESLLSLKHYAFRQLLLSKCALRGKTLVISSEMYTSMTCGNCSRLNTDLGTAAVFRCPHCGFVAGRDANAAFNILRFVSGGSLATIAIHQ